ncbi:MAG: glycosyltransferase [Deltaproteobacteria bacterium]|nr:glycosyltransferase [Deltaproteobacteria bacterium]
MKILLVAVHFYSSFGWSTAQALKRCGHEVHVFDYRKGVRLRAPGLRSLLVRRMNSRLLNVVKDQAPDLIFVQKGELIYPETLRAARSIAGCSLINWFPDPRPMAYPCVAGALAVYDYFFTKNPYWNRTLRNAGWNNVYYLAHAYDVEIQKRLALSPGERERFGADVGFIGSMYPFRKTYFSGLIDVDLKIWGDGWRTLSGEDPMRRHCTGHDVRGMDHTRVINASRINLNLHHYDDIEGVNQRFFDIAGCGGFQIVDEKKEISKYLKPEDEVICYRDAKDLRQKIHYYLEHPDDRETIRERGFRKIQTGNTYEDRIKELFSIVRM